MTDRRILTKSYLCIYSFIHIFSIQILLTPRIISSKIKNEFHALVDGIAIQDRRPLLIFIRIDFNTNNLIQMAMPIIVINNQ